MVTIVDYGSGNLRSVGKALERVGASVRIADAPAGIGDPAAIVLPGVGAFGDCVRNLRERGLWQPVAEWLAADRPFLGICLGYQLLFEGSEESPGVEGFGVLRGRVRRFPAGTGLKVPHMGWNQLELVRPDHPLWRGLGASPEVYFVHSFYPVPEDPAVVTARCEYGVRFAAAAAVGRRVAVQFHPEKSQETGLAMLRNFVESIAP